MEAGRTRLSFQVPSVPESVPQARRTVEEYLVGLGSDNRANAALALTEAVGNAVRHAYPNDDSGEIEIEVEQPTARLVRITVRDRGRGPIVDPDTKGLGAGLPLMLAATEKLEFHGQPGTGTEVILTIRLRI